jgi:mono/diheme cytochrome c family protein
MACALLAQAAIAAQDPAGQVARGRYLARAGDCESCHTARGGRPYAGGRPIPTPFGNIYSVNITPDRATGIGAWSAQDFYTAMHQGLDPDGRHLYPAFPYPWFTKITRADCDAIKAWLDTLAPVVRRDTPDPLPWPLRWRGVMAAWNLLYFDAGQFVPDATRSAQWNRGAYLVDGLGHCGACHTPANALGGSRRDEAFGGGSAGEHWAAPSLGGDLRDGLGDWSRAEIVEYLKTGANAKSASAGPMTEVVMNSTRYLSDADLDAIATYLKEGPAAAGGDSARAQALPAPALARGEALYVDNCTACHMPDGRGVHGVFPPLTGSAAIQAADAGTVVHVVLAGARMAAPPSRPTGLAMPAFGWKLDDGEIADVVNYIRHAWGNRAPLIDADAVAAVRGELGPAHDAARGAAPARPRVPSARAGP